MYVCMLQIAFKSLTRMCDGLTLKPSRSQGNEDSERSLRTMSTWSGLRLFFRRKINTDTVFNTLITHTVNESMSVTTA